MLNNDLSTGIDLPADPTQRQVVLDRESHLLETHHIRVDPITDAVRRRLLGRQLRDIQGGTYQQITARQQALLPHYSDFYQSVQTASVRESPGARPRHKKPASPIVSYWSLAVAAVASLFVTGRSYRRGRRTSDPHEGYFTGTFVAQLGNFGTQGLLTPMMFYLARAAAGRGIPGVEAVVFGQALADFFGSLSAGLFGLERAPALTMYCVTLARAAAMATIPFLFLRQELTAWLFIGAIAVDGFLRGITDSAAYAYKAVAGGNDEDRQKALSAEYQSKFELGAILGPILVASTLESLRPGLGLLVSSALIAAALLVAAVLSFRRVHEPDAEQPSDGNFLTSLRTVRSSPMIFAGFVALLLTTLYPLRNALPHLYTEMLFRAHQDDVGWLVAVFGAGGALGAALMKQKAVKKVAVFPMVAAGVAGMALLALSGFFPVYAFFYPAVFLFAVTNMFAKVSVESKLKSVFPGNRAANLSALMRTGVKFMAFVVKAAPSWFVVYAHSNAQRFALLMAGMLTLFGLGQLASSIRMARSARPVAQPAPKGAT